MMKKLVISLFLVFLFAITPIQAVTQEEEAITLFNQVHLEMKF